MKEWDSRAFARVSRLIDESRPIDLESRDPGSVFDVGPVEGAPRQPRQLASNGYPGTDETRPRFERWAPRHRLRAWALKCIEKRRRYVRGTYLWA